MDACSPSAKALKPGNVGPKPTIMTKSNPQKSEKTEMNNAMRVNVICRYDQQAPVQNTACPTCLVDIKGKMKSVLAVGEANSNSEH